MRIIKAIVIIMVPLLAVSCATVPEQEPPELYWPFPPERPRIKFVDLIIGSLDVKSQRENKFKEILFGDETDIPFTKPTYIAAKDDVLYVSDFDRVKIFDFKNKDFKSVGAGVLRNATGIGVTSDGTMYIGDSALKSILVMKPGESSVKRLGTTKGMLVSPGGVAVDESRDRFLVADAKKHVVSVFSLEGDLLYTIGGRGTVPGAFNFPYDVTVDRDGFIYVVDAGNFRVQIFTPEGNYLSQFGAVGSLPGLFARPKGIAIDSDGYIYVVDSAFSNFQIFDAAGNVYLSIGTGGRGPGKFLLPWGICIDDNDKIYVVDQANSRIQVFQYIKYQDEEGIRPIGPAELGF